MIGQGPHQNKTPGDHELTPRDDNKKIVSEILKRVDQLIKKNNLNLALSEIISAKNIDAHNVYTLALEERIHGLLTNEQNRARVPQAGDKTLTAAPPVPAPVPIPAATTPPPQPHPAPPLPTAAQQQPATNYLNAYRTALLDAWSKGPITPDKDIYIRQIRSMWNISEADHERLEKEVKRDCYKNVVAKLLAVPDGLASNMDKLNEARKVYQISDEEYSKLQAQFSTPVRQRKQREKLLVIDDDVHLLELLTASLEDGGFDVTALPTSDEAYALLRKFTPDLILCDINLETSTMGGFTFYERVQEFKHLQNIPFIFLTGLTDEALVRTGKELGVDDYLMKPISEQTLLSTLRGKLKRFRQLRKISGSSASSMMLA